MINAYQRHEAAWRNQVDQNASRLAHTYAFYETTGWGEFTFPVMFDFELTFVAEPTVAYGYSIDGEKLVPKRFPRAWGGVYDWEPTPKGFYVGAYVFAIVDTLSSVSMEDVPADDPNYTIKHYFSFTGIAIKDLSEDEFDE